MQLDEVTRLLEANQNPRGIKAWERMGGKPGGSYGLGLTQQKKLAKGIGKNHALATELWKQDIYDCKILSILIEEPKLVDRAQIEASLPQVRQWMLAYTFANSLLAKLSYQDALIEEWIDSKEEIRRRLSWLMVANLGRSGMIETNKAIALLDRIGKELENEENFVRDAMNNAMLELGTLNAETHGKAVETAEKIGKVEVDYGDNSCQPLDVPRHLQSDRIRKKAGLW